MVIGAALRKSNESCKKGKPVKESKRRKKTQQNKFGKKTKVGGWREKMTSITGG